MKKGILLICLTFAFSQSTNAQLHFGIKGGVNYNSETIKKQLLKMFLKAQKVKQDTTQGSGYAQKSLYWEFILDPN